MAVAAAAAMRKMGRSEAWLALTTIAAAATYLFDAASNAATAAKYYQFSHQRQLDEVGLSINAGGAFVVVVTLIALAHITNLLMFCTQLQQDDAEGAGREHPVRAALFLPLIHLKRLLQLLARTCSVRGYWALLGYFQLICASITLPLIANSFALALLLSGSFRDTTSPRAASLYSILAAALETGPQLIFQYAVLHAVGSFCSPPHCHLPRVLLISIIASLISGAYNGGVAVASMLHETTAASARLAVGMAAGTHTLCALIIRSFAFAFFVTGAPTIYIVVYACTAFGVPFTLFWALMKPRLKGTLPSAIRLGRQLLHAVANAHVSLSLGPLYPLTADAYGRDLQGRSSFHGVLALATVAHLLLDLGGILLIYKVAFYKASNGMDDYPPPCTAIAGDVFLPCALFVALLSLAVTFYILSMIAYLIIDKAIHTSELSVFESSLTIVPLVGVVAHERWRRFFSRTSTHLAPPLAS